MTESQRLVFMLHTHACMQEFFTFFVYANPHMKLDSLLSHQITYLSHTWDLLSMHQLRITMHLAWARAYPIHACIIHLIPGVNAIHAFQSQTNVKKEFEETELVPVMRIVTQVSLQGSSYALTGIKHSLLGIDDRTHACCHLYLCIRVWLCHDPNV